MGASGAFTNPLSNCLQDTVAVRIHAMHANSLHLIPALTIVSIYHLLLNHTYVSRLLFIRLHRRVHSNDVIISQ
jgi:hypothetical protein